MDLLALCLAVTCVLYGSGEKVKSKADFYPSILDIVCKQATPSTCPGHDKWTCRCPMEMKTKEGSGRKSSFKIKLHKEYKTWDEALKVCQSEKGTLAMPKTKQKQNLLTRLTYRCELDRVCAWIGLRDFDGNNTFRWIDGESLTYVYWRMNEPNYVNERCGSYGTPSFLQRGWNDLDCSRKCWYCCQY